MVLFHFSSLFGFPVFTGSQVIRFKTLHCICLSTKHGKVASNAESLLSRNQCYSKDRLMLIYEKTKSLTHSLFLASACEIRNLLLVSSLQILTSCIDMMKKDGQL